MTMDTAVLTFSGAYVIIGTGLILFMLTLMAASRRTTRQVSRKAQDVFPDLARAETTITDSLKPQWTLSLTWRSISAIYLGTLWITPGPSLFRQP